MGTVGRWQLDEQGSTAGLRPPAGGSSDEGKWQLEEQGSAVGLCQPLRPHGSLDQATAVQLPPAGLSAQQMLLYGQQRHRTVGPALHSCMYALHPAEAGISRSRMSVQPTISNILVPCPLMQTGQNPGTEQRSWCVHA